MPLPHSFADQSGPEIPLSELDENFAYLLSLLGGILPPKVIPGTSYSVLLADHARTLSFTSASPVAVTYPATLPAGHYVQVSQDGDGQVSASSAMTNINRTGAYRTVGKGGVMMLQVWESDGATGKYKVLGDAV